MRAGLLAIDMPLDLLLRRGAWPAICVGAVAIAWLIGTGNAVDPAWPVAIAGTLVGLAWCLTGLAAWGGRPDVRTGALMLLVGLTWLASLLQFTSVSLLHTLGVLAGPLYLAVFIHLLLSFPGGRLGERRARLIVIAAYLDTTVIAASSELFDASRASGGARNLALVRADQSLADALDGSSAAIGVVLFALAIALLAGRWRRATPPWRRAVAPVFWSGIAAAVAVGLLLVFAAAGLEPRVAQALALLVFAAVPFAFLLGLLRTRLERGAVADLVVDLGASTAPGVRDALARARRPVAVDRLLAGRPRALRRRHRRAGRAAVSRR
jgi:hypothetical protein